MTATRTLAPARSAPPRRGLRRPDAAAYVGVGPTKFDELVDRGDMPPPFTVDGCVLWDITELDQAFEELRDRGRRLPYGRDGRDDGWDDV